MFFSWVRSSGKSYTIASGSSMASPYIAGAVAAYLQAFPGSNAQTILEIMQNTARPLHPILGLQILLPSKVPDY